MYTKLKYENYFFQQISKFFVQIFYFVDGRDERPQLLDISTDFSRVFLVAEVTATLG